MRARIPYVIVGDVGFYQRAEIKDALAFLRLSATPTRSPRSTTLSPTRSATPAYWALPTSITKAFATKDSPRRKSLQRTRRRPKDQRCNTYKQYA